MTGHGRTRSDETERRECAVPFMQKAQTDRDGVKTHVERDVQKIRPFKSRYIGFATPVERIETL